MQLVLLQLLKLNSLPGSTSDATISRLWWAACSEKNVFEPHRESRAEDDFSRLSQEMFPFPGRPSVFLAIPNTQLPKARIHHGFLPVSSWLPLTVN